MAVKGLCVLHRVPEFLSCRLNWVSPPRPPHASVSPLPLSGGDGGPNSDDRTETNLGTLDNHWTSPLEKYQQVSGYKYLFNFKFKKQTRN